MSCDFRYDDAAYVLGALAPAERAAYQEHLAGCTSCRRAVAELAGLPGLLGRVSPDVLSDATGPAAPVPATLLHNLVGQVRSERRRRTWAMVGAAAATIAVVGTGAVVVTHALDEPAAPTTNAGQPLAPTGASTPMTARVALTTVAWGTRLDLVCSYPEYGGHGHAYPADYTMVVQTRDGGTEQVASWHGLPGRTMHLSAATATRRADISSVEIRAADGTPVLRLGS